MGGGGLGGRGKGGGGGGGGGKKCPAGESMRGFGVSIKRTAVANLLLIARDSEIKPVGDCDGQSAMMKAMDSPRRRLAAAATRTTERTGFHGRTGCLT